MGSAVKPARSKSKVRVGSASSYRKLTLSPLDKAKTWEIDWSHVAPVFEAARAYADASFVYFVGEPDGPVKIGVAKDPVKRVRQMQTGNPRRLRVERLLVGDMPTEKLLHEMWREYIVPTPNARKADAPPGTEWFEAEIRKLLFPIVETAAEEQVKTLTGEAHGYFDDLELIVRQAHVAHGFEFKPRDQVNLVGATHRRSRI